MSSDIAAPSEAVLSSIVPTTTISRSTSILASEVNGDVFMINIDGGRYFSLDDIGSDVWRRLDRPCSFADLTAALAADYDADEATIAADLRGLLARMAESDIVKLT